MSIGNGSNSASQAVRVVALFSRVCTDSGQFNNDVFDFGAADFGANSDGHSQNSQFE